MTASKDKPEPLYTLIFSHAPMTAAPDPNNDCEVFWGTKEEMQQMYNEAIEDEHNPYPNIIFCKMVSEVQLAYEQIDYEDDDE